MGNFISTLGKIFGNTFVKWPLLLIFVITLPWTILIIPFYGANNYTYQQLCLWVIFSVVAIGLNMLTGLTGMISLGQSAIYAVGAFVAGYFTIRVSLPFPLAILMAAVAAGIVGFILGLPALRLSGPYLAVATFAFAIAVPQLMFTSKEVNDLFADPNASELAKLTSQSGVISVPKQTFLDFKDNLGNPVFQADQGRYYLFLLIAGIMFVLALGIWNSRTGRAFRAIHDSETAAQAMGINIGRYKLLAFVISAMYAGVAGAMYSAFIGQLNAKDGQFSAEEAIIILTAIILGGLGSISGAIIGTGLLTILPATTGALNDWYAKGIGNGNKIENFNSIFYGLIIILCVYFMPQGVMGALRSLVARLRGGKKGSPPAEKAALGNSVNIPENLVSEAQKGS